MFQITHVCVCYCVCVRVSPSMSSETGVRRMSPVNSQAVFLASIPDVPSKTYRIKHHKSSPSKPTRVHSISWSWARTTLPKIPLTCTTALVPITSSTCPLLRVPSGKVRWTISAYLGNFTPKIKQGWIEDNSLVHVHSMFLKKKKQTLCLNETLDYSLVYEALKFRPVLYLIMKERHKTKVRFVEVPSHCPRWPEGRWHLRQLSKLERQQEGIGGENMAQIVSSYSFISAHYFALYNSLNWLFYPSILPSTLLFIDCSIHLLTF